MATKASALYDEDFYAWTQEQAAALRALQGDNRLDVEHLAEEIEDLGKSELHAVESYIEQIISHLLKLHFSGFDLPRRVWRQEIVAFRQNLRRKISPSIERVVQEKLDQLYEGGRNLAAASLEAEPDIESRLPKTNPYDWVDIALRDVSSEDAPAGAPVGRGRAPRKTKRDA